MNSFTTTSTLSATRKRIARGCCRALAELSTTSARQTTQSKNNPKLFSNGSLAGVSASASALASTATPTFFDDLSNAIWRVIAVAIVPLLIIVNSCEQHTNQIRLAFDRQATQHATQYANQYANQQARQTSYDMTPARRAVYAHSTPEGFGEPLSHGGTHDPQKQE